MKKHCRYRDDWDFRRLSRPRTRRIKSRNANGQVSKQEKGRKQGSGRHCTSIHSPLRIHVFLTLDLRHRQGVCSARDINTVFLRHLGHEFVSSSLVLDLAHRGWRSTRIEGGLSWHQRVADSILFASSFRWLPGSRALVKWSPNSSRVLLPLRHLTDGLRLLD